MDRICDLEPTDIASLKIINFDLTYHVYFYFVMHNLFFFPWQKWASIKEGEYLKENNFNTKESFQHDDSKLS